MNPELKKAYETVSDLQTILIFLLKQSEAIEKELRIAKLQLKKLQNE